MLSACIMLPPDCKVLSIAGSGVVVTYENGQTIIIPGAVLIDDVDGVPTPDTPIPKGSGVTSEPVMTDFYQPAQEYLEALAAKINSGVQLSDDERRLIIRCPIAVLQDIRNSFTPESRKKIAEARTTFIDSNGEEVASFDLALFQFVFGSSRLTSMEEDARSNGGFMIDSGADVPAKPAPKRSTL